MSADVDPPGFVRRWGARIKQATEKMRHIRSFKLTKLKTGPKGFGAVGITDEQDTCDPLPPLIADTFRFYPEADILMEPPPSFPDAPPLESTDAPAGLLYPRAAPIQRRPGGGRYLTGVYEEILYDPADRLEHKRRVLRTAVHPALMPEPGEQGYAQQLHVPGQHQLASGVPLVVRHAHDPTLFETQVGCITPKVLMSIPRFARRVGDRRTFREICVKLLKLAFGDHESEDPEARKPLSAFKWTRNLRDGGSGGPGEGSFSLAGTTGEGQGTGVFQPAQQVQTDAADERRLEILVTLGEGGPMALEALNAREENEAEEFGGAQNNVPGPGSDTNVRFSSVQYNHSSLTADMNDTTLEQSLGPLQGTLHVDSKDQEDQHSICALLVRVPRGSDPGAFMFSELGAYVHSWEVMYSVGNDDFCIVWIMLRGQHVHGATAPRLFNGASGTRVMFVCYPTKSAFARTGAMTRTPPIGYGEPFSLDRRRLDFMQHGLPHFGQIQHYRDWHAREMCSHTYNYLMSGIGIGTFGGSTLSLTQAVESVWYTDEETQERRTCSMGKMLDPVLDKEKHDQLYALAIHHKRCALFSLLGIRRQEMKNIKKLLRPDLTANAPAVDFSALAECSQPVAFIADARAYDYRKVAYLVEMEDKPGKWVWIADSSWVDSENKAASKELYALTRADVDKPVFEIEVPKAPVGDGDAELADDEMEVDGDLQEDEHEDEDHAQAGGRGKRKPSEQDADARTTPIRDEDVDPERGVSSGKGKGVRRSGRLQKGAPGKGSVNAEDGQAIVADARVNVRLIEMSMDANVWNMHKAVTAQRDVYSASSDRLMTMRELNKYLHQYRSLTSAITTTTQGSGTRAVIGVQLAIECVRVLPTLFRILLQAHTIETWVSIEVNQAYVHLKDFLIADGPLLANFIYAPVSSVGATPRHPQSTTLPWLDRLAEDIFLFVREHQRAVAASDKQSRSTAIEISLDDDTSSALAEVQVALQRLAADLRAKGLDHWERDDDGPESEEGVSTYQPATPLASPGILRSDLDPPRVEGTADASDLTDGGELAAAARSTSAVSATQISVEVRDTRPTSKANALRTVPYTLRLSGTMGDTAKALSDACSTLLLDALFELLILPAVKILLHSEKSAKVQGYSNRVENAKAFVICRGEALDAFHAASGSRAIWGYQALTLSLWSSPHLLVDCDRPSRAVFLFSGGKARRALQTVASKWFDAHPEVVKGLKDAENLLQFHVQELEHKRLQPRSHVPKPSHEEPTAGGSGVVEGSSPAITLGKRARKRKPRRKPAAQAMDSANDDPGDSTAEDAPPAKRKKKTNNVGPKLLRIKGDYSLDRVEFQPTCANPMAALEMVLSVPYCAKIQVPSNIVKIDQFYGGLRPDGSEGAHTSDQLNALPSCWDMMDMVECVLTASETRERWGLSNWLAFHGSGQCVKTRTFFENRWAVSIPKNAAEAYIMVQAGEAAKEVIEVKNVWGQVSTDIQWGANHCNIPIWFSNAVMDGWERWLRDHSTKLASWSETLDWLEAWNISPFKKKIGLGSIHIVNRLAERGICKMPTIRELADWMALARRFGAYKGLRAIGFNTRNVNDVVLSLGMIHEHLLSRFDQQTLTAMRYSVIALENLLCKVKRSHDDIPTWGEGETMHSWAAEYAAAPGRLLKRVETLDLDAFRNRVRGKAEYALNQ